MGEASDKRSGGLFATLRLSQASALTEETRVSIRSVQPIPGRIYEQAGAKTALIEGGVFLVTAQGALDNLNG
jgi:hypothetical protein